MAARITRRRFLRASGVASACGAFAGCSAEFDDPEAFLDALVAECSEPMVYLSAWWANHPDGESIEIDPIGGYVLVYWIDDGGVVCHGNPGESGWPGPYQIDAIDPAVWDAITNDEPISDGVFKQLQRVPIDVSGYDGTGPHLIQLLPWLWRNRETGEAFTESLSPFSVPSVVEVGSDGFCLAPRNYEDSRCRLTSLLPPYIPPLNGAPIPIPNTRSTVTNVTSRAMIHFRQTSVGNTAS